MSDIFMGKELGIKAADLALLGLGIVLAACSPQPESRICRSINFDPARLPGSDASAATYIEREQQCLIHYSYLLAGDGGSAEAIAGAVIERCQLPLGNAEFARRRSYLNGSTTEGWTPDQWRALNEFAGQGYRDALAKIPTYIIEARAGNCRV